MISTTNEFSSICGSFLQLVGGAFLETADDWLQETGNRSSRQKASASNLHTGVRNLRVKQDVQELTVDTGLHANGAETRDDYGGARLGSGALGKNGLICSPLSWFLI